MEFKFCEAVCNKFVCKKYKDKLDGLRLLLIVPTQLSEGGASPPPHSRFHHYPPSRQWPPCRPIGSLEAHFERGEPFLPLYIFHLAAPDHLKNRDNASPTRAFSTAIPSFIWGVKPVRAIIINFAIASIQSCLNSRHNQIAQQVLHILPLGTLRDTLMTLRGTKRFTFSCTVSYSPK